MAEQASATMAPQAVRERLAVALDVDDLVAAVRLARELRPWFGIAKIGLELYSAEGPEGITTLTDLGFDVFADLKFYDIPTTVNRAAAVIGGLGAKYLNFHGQGGVTMLRAGVEGFLSGAADSGLDRPIPLAVTVLTSDSAAPAHILPQRVRFALESGCAGIVCAAEDVREAKQYGPRLVAVVPGIRPAGTARDDQARSATPAEALAAGADVLVVGRPVTRADDPPAAAAALAAEVAAQLGV
jgi:orotidine-5'-phosphate decarboxylase